MQRFDGLQTVNFLAGKNNSGKTNTLSFLYNVFRVSDQPALSAYDRPAGLDYASGTQWDIKLSVDQLIDELGFSQDSPIRSSLEYFFLSDAFSGSQTDSTFWVRMRGSANQAPEFILPDSLDTADEAAVDESMKLARALNFPEKVRNVSKNVRETLQRVNLYRPIQVQPIEPIRRVREVGPDEDESVLDGRGLVQRLLEMQHPDYGFDHLRAKFDRVNELLVELFEDSTAALEVAHKSQEILVTQSGTRLPLDRHGLGVQQVVILAASITVASAGTVFLIEEPEANLHPALQRRVGPALASASDNQYIIATHSSHMLDYDIGRVFHLSRVPQSGTIVRAVDKSRDSLDLCRDLGYRASDLMQSNCVIWVEGPSDRVYVSFLLQQVIGNEFREGEHYSIMVYGGSLLNSLSADDPTVENFVNLRRINQNMAVVMDRDKFDADDSRVSGAKLRVRREFACAGQANLAWLTWGYTFENYVPQRTFNAAANAVHSRSPEYNWSGSRFDPPFKDRDGADKIAIAHKVCESWSDVFADETDLHTHVLAVAELVRASNT